MRKSTKLLKRFAALFLVVLLSCESFAAVIGDSDGPAFVTKREFEAMKKDYDEQIDRYNKSLDNKIDGAISSYLYGVTLGKKVAVTPPSWYSDVAWRDDLMIYSRRSLYTATSTHSDESAKWRRPNMVQRDLTESGILQIQSLFGPNHIHWWVLHAFTPIPTAGAGLQNALSGVGNVVNWDTADHRALYGEVLRLRRDNDGYFVNQAGVMAGMNPNTWTTKMHKTENESIVIWDYGYDATVNGVTTSDGFVSYTPPDGYMMDYAFKVKRTDNGSVLTTRDRIYGDDLEYQANILDMPTKMIQTNINMTALNTDALRTVDWYNTTTDRSNDYNVIPNMMLGRSQDWKATCYLEKPLESPMRRFDYIKDNTYSTFKTINVTRGQTRARASRLVMTSVSAQNIGVSSSNTTIAYPMWTEIKLNEVRGKYYYNGVPLMWGQGIPLGPEFRRNGEAHIEIKWNKYTGSGATHSNKKIALKIKKGDFLSDGEYCSGKIDGVEGVFDENSVLTSGDENDIVVEYVRENEQLWLQISPAADSSSIYTGDYAKIAYLKVYYVYE